MIYYKYYKNIEWSVFVSNEELTVNTDMWPKEDHNDPLKIRTTKTEQLVQIESNTTVTYPSNKQLLHPKEYCLKYHIYEKVGELRADKNGVLIASYAGKRPVNSDLENILFYNINTGAFSPIFNVKDSEQQVIFYFDNTKDESADKTLNTYTYEVVKENELKNKEEISKMFKDENIIAKWPEIKIDDTLPDKPDRYYAAIRNHASEITEGPSFHNQKEKYPFGIEIELTVPKSNKTSHPVSVMKCLLDGVICAFHGEDGEKTKKAVRERFQKNGLNKQQIEEFFEDEQLNLFGKYNYLTKSSWNPEDNRLQFGWIIVNKGTEYKMSGSIYKWDS